MAIIQEMKKHLQSETFRKIIKTSETVLFWSTIVLLCFIMIFTISGIIRGTTPTIAGNKLFIVLSDSMKPVFGAGSIVLVRPVEPLLIEVNDIITFKDPIHPEDMITHRVIEISESKGLRFITKGDANNTEDFHPVPAANIVGKVILSIPFIGRLLHFTRSKAGIIILLIIPCGILIFNELKIIKKKLVQS